MKRISQLLIGLLLVLGVANFGYGTVNAAFGPPPEKNTVNIRDSGFEPDQIIIRRGETITWVNQDSEMHTVTGDDFDSGPLYRGGVFQYTFSDEGVFDYQCTHYANMQGKVIVQ